MLVLEDKGSTSLSQWTTAAPSTNQILPTIPLCIVTSSVCLFIVYFPTAAMLNSGATSGLGHTDSPAHIKQQRGPSQLWRKPRYLFYQILQSLRSFQMQLQYLYYKDKDLVSSSSCVTQFFHTMLLLQRKKSIKLQCNNHK